MGPPPLPEDHGPTLAAILTLGLGIGANTAIFTLANASMWKPIPLLDLENITMALERAPQDAASVAPVQVGWEPVTPGNYLAFRRSVRRHAVGAQGFVRVVMSGGGGPGSVAELPPTLP